MSEHGSRAFEVEPPRSFPIPLAFAWTGFITASLWLGLSVVFRHFGPRADDIVLLGLTQVAVYGLVVALFALSTQRPLRELLALRSASLRVCLAALALGAALQIPATLLANAVEHFFPVPEAVLRERLLRITPHGTAHGIAIFAVVAGLGPCVEEFFFRGALYGALRRGRGTRLPLLVVSLCFALAHLDLRLLLPLFVAALAIGDVREQTGSLWPGLLTHAAFNAVTLAVVFMGHAQNGQPPPVPPFLAVAGSVIALSLLVLVRALALADAPAPQA